MFCRCVLFAFVVAVIHPADHSHAMFVGPITAPVDRIIANTQAYLAEHPDDSEAHYTLGRAHYLAWTLKSADIWAMPNRGDGRTLPPLPPDWMVGRDAFARQARRVEAQRQVRAEHGLATDAAVDEAFWNAVYERERALEKAAWAPVAPDAPMLDEHAQQAVIQHRKAIELETKNGLYRIGLASILEEYAARAGELGVNLRLNPREDVREQLTPEAMTHLWRLEALAEYRKAYDLTIGDDSKLTHQPIEGLRGLVSYSALTNYLRLTGQLNLADTDTKVVEKMRADKAKLETLQMGAITPIVFAFESVASLDELLLPDRIVHFDLDGDGIAEHRPWVGPRTAMLVWDPLFTGHITSGRQLFGSVTWWLFWPDGYRAMDALDDNRNGELAGDELRGLAIWLDHNGDAISDPGEVMSINATAVAGLSVRRVSQAGASPMNPHGLRLRDGRVLPTWDWVATSVGTGDASANASDKP